VDYPKSVPGIGLVNGQFVDENPVNGTPGSLIPAEWGNAVTTEILGVIQEAGLTPNEADNGQLADAVLAIVTSKSPTAATETNAGILKLSTGIQAIVGTDDTTAVTPKKLQQKLATVLQTQALTAFTTGGIAPAFTLTPSPAITAYTANQRFQVVFSAAGGATPNLNVSGIGPKNLKQYTAAGTKIAAIIASAQTSDVVYDGVDFVVLDPLPNSVSATPGQFDNSTNLATTAFVQGVGFQFSGTFGLSASTTLTASTHAGALVVATSTPTINVTLPTASSMPAKSVIKFWSFGAGGMTIVAAGADSILLPAANTTFSLLTGASVTFASNGVAGWYAIDMSATSPVGGIIQVASLTVPLGYLKANGAAVSRVSYASLFAAIGTVFGAGDGSTTFNIPDLRGEFVRGFDDGRGVDASRVLGSLQLDALQNITGQLNSAYSSGLVGNALGAFTVNGTGSVTYGNAGPIAGNLGVGFSAANSPGARTSTETRPRNVALLHCIKY